MEGIRTALVDGVDFGRVQTKRGMSRPSLRKPGAEKICGMLGLSVLYPTLQEYERAAIEGREIVSIVLRCELINGQGVIVAVGIGARSVKQDYGDLNKALKMAAKSAQIDAVLRCAGLSEVFTQDIEDMIARGEIEADPQAAPVKPATEFIPNETPAERAKTSAERLENCCTVNLADDIPDNPNTYNGQAGLVGNQSKSHRALEAALRDAGLANYRERVKKYCQGKYGVDHFPKLTIEQARELRRAFPGIKAKIDRQEAEAKAKAEMQADHCEIARIFQLLENANVDEYERCMKHYGVKTHVELVQKKDRESLLKHLRTEAKVLGIDLDNKAEPPELIQLRDMAARIRQEAEHADDPAARQADLDHAADIDRQIQRLKYQLEENANAHRYN